MAVQADGSAPAWGHDLAREATKEIERLRALIVALEKRVKALEAP